MASTQPRITSALDIDDLTLRLYEGCYQQATPLQELSEIVPAPKIRDVFMVLYLSHKPQLKPLTEEEAADDPAYWRPVIEQMLTMPLVNDFRLDTVLSVVESTLGTVAICERLEKEDLENISDELLPSVCRRAIKDAIEETEELIQQIEDISDEFDVGASPTGGGDGDGLETYGPTEVKFRLAEMFRRNPRFKRLAEELGRMKLVERRARKINPHTVSDEVTDLGVGDNYAQTLPSEWAADDALLDSKLAEGSLAEYKKHGREKLAKGDILFLHDKSSSMDWHVGEAAGSGDLIDTRDDWSTALMLSVLRIARRDKRTLLHIPFADMVWKTVKFERGAIGLDDLMERMALAPNGGTDFEHALDTAVKALESGHLNAENADVLFVTDGEAYLNQHKIDEYRRKFDELGVRVYSVCIASGCQLLRDLSGDERYFDRCELADNRTEALQSIYSSLGRRGKGGK